MEKEEKTYVEDIDRSIYDIKDEEKDAYQAGGRADTGHRAADFQGEKGSGLDGAFPSAVSADLQ